MPWYGGAHYNQCDRYTCGGGACVYHVQIYCQAVPFMRCREQPKPPEPAAAFGSDRFGTSDDVLFSEQRDKYNGSVFDDAYSRFGLFHHCQAARHGRGGYPNETLGERDVRSYGDPAAQLRQTGSQNGGGARVSPRYAASSQDHRGACQAGRLR